MKRLIIGLGLPALGLAMLLAALGSTSNIPSAHAAPGDLLATVTVPVPHCTPAPGCGSLGVGGTFDGTNYIYINFDFVNAVSTLHIMTPPPGNGAGTLVDSKAIVDGVGNPVAVSAIAWDPGRNKLWGAFGNDVYLIDISAPGDAVATFQFNPNVAEQGLIDGLAYDGSDDTLYHSPDAICNVYHFSLGTGANPPLGTLMNTVTPENAAGEQDCLVSGVVVGSANSLYIGRDGASEIRRVDKTTGAFISSFATTSGRVEDLTCDPVTYAPLEAVLAKDAYNNLYEAFEVEPGTCPLAGTPVGKAPRLQNIWLCNFESAFSDNCNREADIGFTINPNITTADPKCVGFPNFRPDAECDRQVVGSWEFEVRFDQKYIDVQLEAGYRLREGIDNCATTKGQGFVQIRCNTKGKDGHLAGISRLAIAHITATADVFSLLKANQENGIVTQLINQDCNLADTQGHPIPLAGGHDWCANDGAVTIRYLEGDVHADCVIDVHDQQQIAFRWGSHLGQLLYNSNFDLEPSSPKLGDGDIDAKDLQMVFGRHESSCKAPHPAQDPVDPKAKVEPPIVNGDAH